MNVILQQKLKTECLIAENEILYEFWMSKTNTAFHPGWLFFTPALCSETRSHKQSGDPSRDGCELSVKPSFIKPSWTIRSFKQLGCLFSYTFEKLSHSWFPASILEQSEITSSFKTILEHLLSWKELLMMIAFTWIGNSRMKSLFCNQKAIT